MYLYELLEKERILAIRNKVLVELFNLMSETIVERGSISSIIHLTQGFKTLDDVSMAININKTALEEVHAKIRKFIMG